MALIMLYKIWLNHYQIAFWHRLKHKLLGLQTVLAYTYAHVDFGTSV